MVKPVPAVPPAGELPAGGPPPTTAGAPAAPEVLPTGTVLRAVSGFFDVQPDDPQEPPLVRCRLRELLRKELVRTESKGRPQRVRQVRRLSVVEPVVAGDRVRFRLAPPRARPCRTA